MKMDPDYGLRGKCVCVRAWKRMEMDAPAADGAPPHWTQSGAELLLASGTHCRSICLPVSPFASPSSHPRLSLAREALNQP